MGCTGRRTFSIRCSITAWAIGWSSRFSETDRNKSSCWSLATGPPKMQPVLHRCHKSDPQRGPAHGRPWFRRRKNTRRSAAFAPQVVKDRRLLLAELGANIVELVRGTELPVLVRDHLGVFFDVNLARIAQ